MCTGKEQTHKTLLCPCPQARQGPQPLPPGDRWCQVPPLRLRELAGAGGPQPQLRPHQTGDPRPPPGAAGLPTHLPPGEEAHHGGVHVCCSGRPLPVLGGISSGWNIGKKRCPLQTPCRRNPRHPPCIPGIQRDFSFWTWANYLLRVLILSVCLWILAQKLPVANGGGGKGKWRKSCVCDSKQGGSKAALTFFTAAHISFVNQMNYSFKRWYQQ